MDHSVDYLLLLRGASAHSFVQPVLTHPSWTRHRSQTLTKAEWNVPSFSFKFCERVKKVNRQLESNPCKDRKSTGRRCEWEACLRGLGWGGCPGSGGGAAWSGPSPWGKPNPELRNGWEFALGKGRNCVLGREHSFRDLEWAGQERVQSPTFERLLSVQWELWGRWWVRLKASPTIRRYSEMTRTSYPDSSGWWRPGDRWQRFWVGMAAPGR